VAFVKTMSSKTKKLYCYVDETGQDTLGRFFLVAIVITGEEREIIIKELELIEKETLKGASKWKKASLQRRVAYMERIVESKLFLNKINYAAFSGRKDYQELTIIATAKAIISTAPAINYEASVYVDALGSKERVAMAAGLRQRQIKVKKVRGMTDESNAIIRLADAVAGFVRDYLEGGKKMETIYKKALQKGLIKKL
jgi:hypothetical protein